MKKRKKYCAASILLAAFLCLCLAGCGRDAKTQDTIEEIQETELLTTEEQTREEVSPSTEKETESQEGE